MRRAVEILLKPWIVFLVVVFLHGAISFKSGPYASPDTTTFVRWSDQLRNAGYDYGALRMTLLPRFGFITLLALLRDAAGAAWPIALVFLNLLAEAATAALVVYLTLRITRARLAALFVFVWFVLCIELVSWTRYLLSDTTYLILSFGAVSLLVAAVTGPAEKRRSPWIGAAVLVALSLLWRPSGITLFPPLFVAILLARRGFGERQEEPARLRKALLAVVACALVLLLTAAFILSKSGMLSGEAAELSRAAAEGIVIDDRPDTFHRPPVSYADYVTLVGDRFLHFFYFITPMFSAKHNAYNALYFIPLYVLALLALLVASRRALPRSTQDTIILTVTAILSVTVFQAATLIDFDWRYRLPIIPLMMLLAGVAVAVMLEEFSRRNLRQGTFAPARYQ